MKTLEEIKREYARERGFMGLLHMEYDGMIEARDVNEVAKRYAKEVAQQTIKNVCKNFDEKSVVGQTSIAVISAESNIPEL